MTVIDTQNGEISNGHAAASSTNSGDLPQPDPLISKWHLRHDAVHLDHGSSGACSRQVLAAQNALREELELSSPEFFATRWAKGLRRSKEAMAEFIHADRDGLLLVPGTTYGLNVVSQSLTFQPGDELLTTNHAYSSVHLILKAVASRFGAKVVVVDVPFPIGSSDDVVESILAKTNERTRFAIIDDIVSRSALVFPIKRIVDELHARGVDTLVDGAHGPGQSLLDIEKLGAAYYTASCHKWMCAPRGVGFLHIRKDRRDAIQPLIIARSCYFRDTRPDQHTRLEHQFDWLGTLDPSAYLCVPNIINFLQTAVPGGYPALVRRNHEMALRAREHFLKVLNIPKPCPDDMVGSMVALPLPDAKQPRTPEVPLMVELWQQHRTEVQVYYWPAYPRRMLRFSCQAHNSMPQYEWLAARVKEILAREEAEGL